MTNKLLAFLMAVVLLPFLLGVASGFSVPVNSSITSQSTTVPLQYRAIVAIILIIVVVFGIWKFFKLFIGAIFAFILLMIILSTAYYYFTTGTFSLHNSLAFLEYIWQFFAGHITFIHTISNTVHSISNVSKTINNITGTTNTMPTNAT